MRNWLPIFREPKKSSSVFESRVSAGLCRRFIREVSSAHRPRQDFLLVDPACFPALGVRCTVGCSSCHHAYVVLICFDVVPRGAVCAEVLIRSNDLSLTGMLSAVLGPRDA